MAAQYKDQQNGKYRSYGDRDGTINHISDCRKLAQKVCTTRHDWEEKLIHWKSCNNCQMVYAQSRIHPGVKDA